MYVSRLRMQFTRWAGYPAHAHCRPFVAHLAYYCKNNEDDEERSRRLDAHGCLPTSDLAVEAMITLTVLETAVTTQCTSMV